MNETVAKESRRWFNIIKGYVKNGEENKIPYLSGTMNKRTRMYKEAKRYEDDAQIDFELGVINKEEYELEIKAVRVFEKALANYSVY